MKIKEVCEKTELTDKTIRFYIRVGLIFPNYNENYTGRKNFNFENKDIKKLKQVAILRKYGFSVNKIKELFNTEMDSKTIFCEHFKEIENETENTQKIYNRMQEVIKIDFSNVNELCTLLEKSDYVPKNVPSVDDSKPFKILYSKNKKAKILLIILIIICITFSAISIGAVCKAFYNATNSSVLDISKSFVGFRVIETNNTSYGDKQGIQIINDFYISGDSLNQVSNKFEKVNIAKIDGINIIQIKMNTDMKYAKIVPIYENDNLKDTVFYNSSAWVCTDDSPTITSIKCFKSNNNKFKYSIEFKHK